ncbi:glycosyltransferase [Amycolatopsis dongchuanensis]
MTGFVPNGGQQPATTDVGGAIGLGIGGLMSQAAIASTTAEVQKLVDSAKSGGFAISEEGADEYIRVFRDFENVASQLLRTARDASQKPQLGSSAYARTVANHTVLVANGDAQSYNTALQSLINVVSQARTAFEQAKKNYAQMDDEVVQTFSGVQN